MKKEVVITGAGRGLAHSILKRHLEAGDRVLGLVRRITDEMTALMDQYPDQLYLTICDVTDEAQTVAVRSAFCEMIGDTEGRVDLIYNVAGISPAEHRTVLADTDLSMDTMGLMYNVNAVGPLRICQALLPFLQNGSLILNISSEAGSIAASTRKAEYGYCMSKAALNMATRLLCNDIADRGARALAIHPGWVRTEMGGPEAAASDTSISPEESAAGICRIAETAHTLPADVCYLDYAGNRLEW